MTRVLHVLAPGPLGGLERVVQTLAAAQQASGAYDDVRVLTLGADRPDGNAEFAAPLRARGVHVDTLATPRRHYAAEQRAIVSICRGYRAGIVHTHGARADVMAAGAASRVGAAAVTTMHGLVGGDVRNRFYEWLQRRSCRRDDAVVAVARPLASRLILSGVPAERMHVVRNAWQPTAAAFPRNVARERLGLPPGAFVIGWVGRISPEKGLDVMLRALPSPLLRDAHLAVIGDGASRAALERQEGETRHAPVRTVSWHGYMAEASRYLSAFDVLAVSSRTEGSPMVLLEAMAAHVPVVATRVGGIPDIIGESDALLVRPEDPKALALAIDEVRRDPLAARHRAAGANARLQLEFDVPQWVERYRYIYVVARGLAGFRR